MATQDHVDHLGKNTGVLMFFKKSMLSALSVLSGGGNTVSLVGAGAHVLANMATAGHRRLAPDCAPVKSKLLTVLQISRGFLRFWGVEGVDGLGKSPAASAKPITGGSVKAEFLVS
jgi:hypothetical protein